MKVTLFLEIFLQQCLGHCHLPNGLYMQILNIQEWTELSWRNNVYNSKFSVPTCLEHGFTIEYTYLQ